VSYKEHDALGVGKVYATKALAQAEVKLASTERDMCMPWQMPDGTWRIHAIMGGWAFDGWTWKDEEEDPVFWDILDTPFSRLKT